MDLQLESAVPTIESGSRYQRSGPSQWRIARIEEFSWLSIGEQMRDRIPTLEPHDRGLHRVTNATGFLGRYDDYGMSSSDQTIRERKRVRQQMSDIKSG